MLRISQQLFAAGRCGNQHGAALVLTLVMLTVLGLLGAMAMMTSQTELGIIGNFRSSKESFYAAQRAVEYSMTSGAIYTAIGTGTVDLEQGGHAALIRGGGQSGLHIEPSDADESNVDNKVRFVVTGPPPPGSGSDPTYFQSRYYVISVTGEGPRRATTRVEAQVARLAPR